MGMFDSSYIAFFFLIFATMIFPQQSKEKIDSTSRQKIPFQYYMLNYQLTHENSFRVSPKSLLPFNSRVKANNFYSFWSGRSLTSKELSDKIDLENKLPSILVCPLILKYQREEKLSLVWGVLEKIKYIVAFYLAYKHIQRYGLFHQP